MTIGKHPKKYVPRLRRGMRRNFFDLSCFYISLTFSLVKEPVYYKVKLKYYRSEVANLIGAA